VAASAGGRSGIEVRRRVKRNSVAATTLTGTGAHGSSVSAQGRSISISSKFTPNAAPLPVASPPPRAGAIRERMRSAAGKRTGFLEHDPQTSSGAPNHTATLPGAAEQQLKSIWQLGLPRYLEACSAGGIVYNSAINDGSFRVNDQFGHGISRRRPNTCEPSRIHRRSSKTTRPTVNFAEYFECFVECYSYRNIPAAARIAGDFVHRIVSVEYPTSSQYQ
jgi:hypothetical protein